jgi:hypothetical protein
LGAEGVVTVSEDCSSEGISPAGDALAGGVGAAVRCAGDGGDDAGRGVVVEEVVWDAVVGAVVPGAPPPVAGRTGGDVVPCVWPPGAVLRDAVPVVAADPEDPAPEVGGEAEFAAAALVGPGTSSGRVAVAPSVSVCPAGGEAEEHPPASAQAKAIPDVARRLRADLTGCPQPCPQKVL